MRVFDKIASAAQTSTAVQLGVAFVVFLIAPALVVASFTLVANTTTSWLTYPVALAYLFTCFMIMLETNLAIKKGIREIPPAPTDGWDPIVTILIVAYLPNEAEIVEQSIDHLCNEVEMPEGKLQVLLAYNTPEDMEIEKVLHSRAEQSEKFDCIRVEGSTSKGENIMGALPHVKGEVVAILDTDHHVHPDSAQIALRWINAGYDVVQGRCLVRNSETNLLTRMIAVEFEIIYGISHQGRSLLTDTAVFGGANGWWRTSVLRRLGVDNRMLTEDIDVTMRALLSGARIVHERAVISTELAPTTFSAWWKQRTRWAQGWFQVTMKYSAPVYRSSVLTRWVKVYWQIMLGWRELFPIVALQVFAFLLGRAIAGKTVAGIRDPFLIFSTGVTLSVGFLLAVFAWRVAAPESRRDLGARWFLIFGFLSLPYTLLKNAVAQAAIVRELLGDRRWNVTRR